jgi:salicylate hydroxylase
MSYQNHPTFPIAIVGGGLGGLALAIGLSKRNVKVCIYEATGSFSQIGAGVAFGPNSTRALHLIDPALLQGYKEHATFNEDRTRDDTFLSFRWGMDERKEGGARAGDLMCYIEDKLDPGRAKKLGVRTRSCIHRARLLDVLVSLLPEGITTFGKSFQSAEEQPDGSIKLRFADGTTALASAVVGCDGIKSKVREVVCGSAIDASYVGEYAYRALIPRVEAEKAVGPELARNGQMYCGYGGYIVSYPVEHADFTNMVAIHHEPGDVWSWNHEDWTVPADGDEFVREFKGWHPPLVEVIEKYRQRDIWAMYNVAHNAPYYKGRICLLGDSAHASTPHLGAGAGMAMEDAFILSNLIASVRGHEDIERAFHAYDAVRRPRTQKLIDLSRQAGMGCEFLIPRVADHIPALQKNLEEWYNWVWHYDLEDSLAKAKTLLLDSRG